MRAKTWLPRLLPLCLLCTLHTTTVPGASAPLFDNTSFDGWEGETNKVWRIRDGVILGGSLQGNSRNEFLATRKSFKNFHLRFEYKLVGTEGFVNGGVQFRSKRIANPPNEMSGYQADIGAGYSGCLYDESRRNKMLAMADSNLVARLEKLGDWNRYEVIAHGADIQLLLNGQRTTTWVEREPSEKDPTQISFLSNPLPEYAVFNARVGYEVIPQRLSVSVIGTNIGRAHVEHPFGNLTDRRVLVSATVTP